MKNLKGLPTGLPKVGKSLKNAGFCPGKCCLCNLDKQEGIGYNCVIVGIQ